MGAKPTIIGLSGVRDIMLNCFVNLSRSIRVGISFGLEEKLDDILSSINQVAEGVNDHNEQVAEGISTAGVVVALAEKYNTKMPVLTAAACIIDSEMTTKKAVVELMRFPQAEEV